MRIDVLTLFPDMLPAMFSDSIMKRALERKLVEIHAHNIRDFTHDRHHTVDDYPYGGGAGMVLKPEPICEALEAVKADIGTDIPVILLTPQGRLFNQKIAREFAERPNLVFICGRYEGVDERVREHMITDEISIGDYVLTGGELPALVVMDAVLRLIPGVLGSPESAGEDSHAQGLLEYPQYTRPEDFRGWRVPEVLLSGDHGRVARWRREQVIKRTLARRPDLLDKAELTPDEKILLEHFATQQINGKI